MEKRVEGWSTSSGWPATTTTSGGGLSESRLRLGRRTQRRSCQIEARPSAIGQSVNNWIVVGNQATHEHSWKDDRIGDCVSRGVQADGGRLADGRQESVGSRPRVGGPGTGRLHHCPHGREGGDTIHSRGIHSNHDVHRVLREVEEIARRRRRGARGFRRRLRNWAGGGPDPTMPHESNFRRRGTESRAIFDPILAKTLSQGFGRQNDSLTIPTPAARRSSRSKEVADGLAIFVQGFKNQAALPREQDRPTRRCSAVASSRALADGSRFSVAGTHRPTRPDRPPSFRSAEP